MLKKRDLHECHSLYLLMSDPDIFPYVRYKSQSYDHYVFITKQLMIQEEQGACISRTILSEAGHPIGTIDLYDIENKTGFLATWIGLPYFGKGHNQRAKEAFFTELFLEHEMETVYVKIRKHNIRSKKAMEKLPYAKLANEHNLSIYRRINEKETVYDLYQVERESFLENNKMSLADA
ncbi:GNAT family N-acetyltransferase [Paenibacillus sp. NEAU-GSW1]|uniref:GNAT family N-acetyltransferase n=1 Tax=Paenibacillus sp. NEAU-GSW1 TaxID=2682486 RepID=UPI0012E2D519|nr:GNAT family protein [Paenibacillus sp. NEAU-GSW1]MUT68109.1 GNAT family N-acetyltransferase [Paenibacillus sp. NEAU-GSW1]